MVEIHTVRPVCRDYSGGNAGSSITLAERKAAASPALVFMYLFTWETDYLGDLFKAYHVFEIPFVFDNIDDLVEVDPFREELDAWEGIQLRR